MTRPDSTTVPRRRQPAGPEGATGGPGTTEGPDRARGRGPERGDYQPGRRRSQRPVARLAERDPRLHYAARAEDALNDLLAATLRRRGWVPRVLGYTGYGRAGGAPGGGEGSGVAAPGAGWVRVLGRVLVSRPGTGTPPGEPDDGGRSEDCAVAAAEAGRGDDLRAVALSALRGWRQFFSAPLAGAEVDVTVGGVVHRLRSGRGGYVDARLPADLPAGVHGVRMDVVGVADAVATADVVVVAADQRYGVVSDIDDTVMVTSLPRPLIAAWNTFVLPERARRPVPGMAELLSDAVAEHPGSPLVYVSTGAWNTAPVLGRFTRHHGFPRGPMLLTDWGPTNTGWFRSGVEHKRHALRRLAAEFPDVSWLLVGDDGQHDPTTYADFAAAVPGAVRAVAIRQLTPTEQVLSHASFQPVASAVPVAAGPAAGAAVAHVPQVKAPDGDGLAHQLRQLGLL